MKAGQQTRRRVLVYAGVISLIAINLVVWWRTPTTPLNMSARLAALLGYTALFLAISSTEYAPQVRRVLGVRFLRMHHFLAIGGLILIVVHPLAMALEGQGLSIFVPRLDTVMTAFRNGGRIAIYLFPLGALAACQRRRLSFWRTVHFLNYVALLLACVHGLLLGTDLRGTVLTVLWPVMAASAAAIFIHKRLQVS